MEKEALVAALREKSGVDNLSERTIAEVAQSALPLFADDDKITDDTWAPFVQMLRSVSGQYRHDVADGIAGGKSQWELAAKAQWEKDAKTQLEKEIRAELEKKAPAPNPAPEEKPAPVDMSKLVADAVASAMAGLTAEEGAIGKMTKQFNDYVAKAEQEKKDAIIADKRKALRNYLIEERMADREPVVNLVIKDYEISADSDIDRMKVDIEKKYEALYKELYGDAFGGPFAGGAGGVGNGQDSKNEFDKYIAEKREAADKEAKDADELRKLMR